MFVEQAEKRDGKLVLVTNVTPMEPSQVIERYKELADIERGFRVLKNELDMAPVHHRLPDRIRAQAQLCFLALLLHRIIRQRLRAASSPHSVASAFHQLRALQAWHVKAGRSEAKGTTVATPEQLDLFRDLKLSQPTQRDVL